MLEEDGTSIDEDDVVNELEKNTLVMVMDSQDIWKHANDSCDVKSSSVKESGNFPPAKRDGNLRLTFEGGNLHLRKPTELVIKFHSFHGI